MLPFLKTRPAAGIMVAHRKPDGNPEAEQGSDEIGLKACAADLIKAVHSQDEAGVAAAIRAAFELLEMQPHDEGNHTYDAQNEKAAKQG